ncbi:MAG: caspase family protein [Hyphomicrobium sp.]
MWNFSMLRSIKWMLLCASFLLSLSLNCSAEDAERRVALVIGNSAYQNVPALPNPRNDAQGLTASLRRMNFEVVQALDVPRGEMVGYMRQFRELLPGADVALLFYAGHGLAYEGQNYIVPTDASLEDEFDVKLNMHAIDLITDQMARSARINIVMLDACRDNPLARSLSRSLEGASRSASASRGLARIEQVGPQSVIMLATTDGETASDGIGAHSPFTQALLDNIETEGMELSELTRRVRKQVLGATRDRQRPVTFGSSVDAFYFVPAKGGVPVPPPARDNARITVDAGERDHRYWTSIVDLNSVELFQKYLERFPNGEYAAVATAKMEQLRAKDSGAKSSAPTANADEDYREAILDGSDAKLRDFVTRHPDHVKTADLKQMLDEREAWRNAEAKDTLEAYERYLLAFPRGIYSLPAKDRLAALTTRAIPTPPAKTARAEPPPDSAPAFNSPLAESYAPSFNCAENKGAAEQAICSSPRLSGLDVEMANLFGLVRGRMTNQQGLALRNSQRDWIKKRDSCGWDAACIEALYARRIQQLRNG